MAFIKKPLAVLIFIFTSSIYATMQDYIMELKVVSTEGEEYKVKKGVNDYYLPLEIAVPKKCLSNYFIENTKEENEINIFIWGLLETSWKGCKEIIDLEKKVVNLGALVKGRYKILINHAFYKNLVIK